MIRSNRLAIAALIGAASALMSTHSAALAQTAAPVTKPAGQPAKKPAPQAHKESSAESKSTAIATEAAETISDSQLLIANRVLTGTARCEFNQTVDVQPLQDRPGYFKVAFNKASWTMTPQETTTGAVRLEDKKNGVVWLQIPTKSMMMNHKIGQRMVDGCMHAEQQAAANPVATR